MLVANCESAIRGTPSPSERYTTLFLLSLSRCSQAVIDTYDDHRIAMSFAVLGTRLTRITILDKDCTDKTYPEFWDDFSFLNYRVQGALF